MFGNLGATEIIFILVIVLLVFGAKRLPEIGQSLGKGIREFRKSMTEISGEIHQATQQPQPPQYPPPQYAPPPQYPAAPPAAPPAQLPQNAAVPAPQQAAAETVPAAQPAPPPTGGRQA